jgi:DNA polymerase III alpha subunit
VSSASLHGEWCKCEECAAAACVVGGEIVRWSPITTKTGKSMGFADLAFGSDSYSLTFFTDSFRAYHNDVKLPTAFLVSAVKNDRGNLTVLEMVDVVELAKEQGWEPPPLQPPAAAAAKKRRAKFRLVKSGQIEDLGDGVQAMVIGGRK